MNALHASRAQVSLPIESDRVDVVPLRTSERRKFATVGLFAGVGGIEKGLAAAGHAALLLCEIEPMARAVLARHFADVDQHDDVRTLKALPKGTELLAGGFPCQDLSQAGLTRGIDGMRSGLVRDALRLAASHRVPWLLLENVPFMLQLAQGRALEVIVSALEELGYAWAYRVVDARCFGLPQRRERVFLVASLDGDPRAVLFADEAGPQSEPALDGSVAAGFYWTEGVRGLGWAVDAVPTLKGGSTVGVASPPAVWMPDGRIVTPSIEDAEALQGFPRGWTRPAEAVAKKGYRWKLVGNAVSVPAFKWLGERLASPGEAVLRNPRAFGSGGTWPSAAFNVGRRRVAVDASKWPVHRKRIHLHEVLDKDPPPAVAASNRRLSQANEDGFTALPAGVHPRDRDAPQAHGAPQAVTEGPDSIRLQTRLRDGFAVAVDQHTSTRMAGVRQHGTKPEMAVRHVFAALGFHYRVRNRDLPGSPDIANRTGKWAVFVHGCFWHRHPDCDRATSPKRNAEFWSAKFESNVARDSRTRNALRAMGFRTLTIWECQVESPRLIPIIERFTAGLPEASRPPGTGSRLHR